MGNIGDAISTTVPAVGSSGPGYATDINALLDEVKARLTAAIPLSSLLTNSDFDVDGQAILNAAYLTMVSESSTPAASPVNRYTTFNGNAWFVGTAGAVQITNGAALNAAGIGGITGDYSGAGPMEFRYDTANTRYDAFANQSTNTWAYVRGRGFDIAGSATSAFRLRQTYGGTVNQTLIWPATLPASTSIMQMGTTGTMSYSNTIDGFGHGDRKASQVLTIHNTLYVSGTAASAGFTSNAAFVSVPAGAEIRYQLPGLVQGDRLKSVSIYGTAANEPTISVAIQVRDAFAALASTSSGTIVTNSYKTFTLDTPNTTSGDDETIWIRISAVTTAFSAYTIQYVYDRVAS